MHMSIKTAKLLDVCSCLYLHFHRSPSQILFILFALPQLNLSGNPVCITILLFDWRVCLDFENLLSPTKVLEDGRQPDVDAHFPKMKFRFALLCVSACAVIYIEYSLMIVCWFPLCGLRKKPRSARGYFSGYKKQKSVKMFFIRNVIFLSLSVYKSPDKFCRNISGIDSMNKMTSKCGCVKPT